MLYTICKLVIFNILVISLMKLMLSNTYQIDCQLFHVTSNDRNLITSKKPTVLILNS